MILNGLHHISAITADARASMDFYVGTLGLRLIAKTVNQDDPGAYHLFYGDEDASPGADLTFFEYPGARRGVAGAGVAHRITWRVASAEALDFWERRLTDRAQNIQRTPDALQFADPEGLAHALTVYAGPDAPLAARHPEIPAECALQGFHGVDVLSARVDATETVLIDLLGGAPTPAGAIAMRGDTRSSQIAVAPAKTWARPGAGVIHHIALGTCDADLAAWDTRIRATGLSTSGLVDRHFFHSVYVREPGGLLIELATREPGFGVTGAPEDLGRELFLPPWLESRRAEITDRLTPLPDPRADWPRGSQWIGT